MRDALSEDLAATIGAWPAPDAEARFTQAAWLALAAVPQLLSRSANPCHFTASALPIAADGTAVCLVHHRRLGQWVQPGGHFEATDATVAAAAAREMSEETGLIGEVDSVPLLLSRHAAPCGVGEWHLDVQLMAVTPVRNPIINPESIEVSWFEAATLPARTASGVKNLVSLAVTRLRGSGPPGSAPLRP